MKVSVERRALTVLALCIILLSPTVSAAGWYDSNWEYRKNITLNQSQIDGSHQDFPVLINITDADLKEKSLDNGGDILFTSSNGTYKLSHEIESYDNSTGKLTAHVKVPEITDQSSTSVLLYYGNTEAGNQENIADVWSNGYEAVYHLNEGQTGTGNSGLYKDSTSNNRDGDDEVSASGQEGKIHEGQNFDANDDYIDLGFESVVSDSDFTLSTWFHVDSTQYSTLLDTYDGSFPQVSLQYNEGQTGLDYRLHDGSELLKTSAGLLSTGVTYQVVGVRNSSDSILYLDGQQADTSSKASLSSDLTGSGNLQAGRRPDGVGPLDGFMDEIRISSVARSEAWLSTTYNNQENPSKFHEVGPEERKKSSSKYVKTFNIRTGRPQNFYANNTVVKIRTKGSFDRDPEITIRDSSGNLGAYSSSMTNLSSNMVYELNYTLNGSYGWYDVEINDNKLENVFYQSSVWQDNFTDADGNKYTFRRAINVSEPGVSDRSNEPVDLNLDFAFRPDNETVRVVSWNGSRMLEIPSQLYNRSQSEGEISNANVVFLSSLEKSKSGSYYIMYSKSDYGKSYSGLNNSNTESDNKTENSYYSAYFNQSLGGLMRTVENKRGTEESLSGSEPMDLYPELQKGLTSFKARIDSTADINTTEGPIFSKISVSGNLNDDESKPYTVECEMFAANPYMMCEKNLTSLNSETWSNFYLNGLVMKDGAFNSVAYRNSSDNTTERSVSDGDGADYISLDNDMRWISFSNNETGDGVADIFLKKDFGPVNNPVFQVFDDTTNDFFRQRVIASGTQVSQGDYYFTETARLFYNGLRDYKIVEEYYKELNNSIEVSVGQETTDDKDRPNYTSSGNVSSDDRSKVKIKSKWKDDTFLDYAEINIKGNGINGSKTQLYYNNSYEIREDSGFTNESWVNVTLENSTVNAGKISANVTVFDVAGKSNSTLIELNVSDATPPIFKSVEHSPENKSRLDPGVKVNVSTNITEYSNISEVLLFYRNSSGDFSKKKMQKKSEEDFVQSFSSNFTAKEEDNYTFYISANDTEGQRGNSSEKEIEVEWDYTWSIDANLSDETATFERNVSAGNLSIENTGDFSQEFEFSNGLYNSRTWLNGTNLPRDIEIGEGGSKSYRVNATTRDSTNLEDVETFNLTIESNESSKKEHAAFDVTTSTGGPFLFTEITQYNSTVTQGDQNITIKAETTNKGNETAERVNISFELPSGWTASEGKSLVSSETLILDIGTTKTFTTKVDVAEDANTGSKKLKAVTRGKKDKRSFFVDVTVENSSTEDEEDGQQETGGGGGGGSTGEETSELTEDQKNELFQTEESFEIVRGEDQEFPLKVSNPFSKGELEDIKVSSSGFLSQYISIEPEVIESISVNGSKDFSVNIEAPRYFTRGEYTLNFNITGINNRTQLKPAGEGKILIGETNRFKEERTVKLTVHEITGKEAEESLNRSKEAIEVLNQSGYISRETIQLAKEAEEALESGNRIKAKRLSSEILNRRETVENAEKTLEEVEQLVQKAEDRGIESERTERMLSMTEAALERGDYGMAAQRAEEAKNIYALETQGKTNYLNYAKNNWKKITLAILLIIGTTGAGYLRYRLFKVRRKLSKLENEEKTIKGLMKQVQRESFEEGKMSMEEYEEAMMQYEQQLSHNIKKTVEMETRKETWPKIWSGSRRLKEEKDKIQKLMQDTQKDYLEEGELDTRVYKQKMQTFRERLGEIEGTIAEKEAKERMNRSRGLRIGK